MAKKPTNPGEPKPRRGISRRRTEKPVEQRAAELAPPPAVDVADDVPAPVSALPPAGRNLNAVFLREADRRPSPGDVARRAYEIYRSRGGGDGRDLEDWLQAERELRGGPDRARSGRK